MAVLLTHSPSATRSMFPNSPFLTPFCIPRTLWALSNTRLSSEALGFLRGLGCNSEGASQGALSSLRALQWILLAELRKEYNRRPGTPAQAFLECLRASVTSGPHQWPLGTSLPPTKVQLCQNRKAALFPVLKSLPGRGTCTLAQLTLWASRQRAPRNCFQHRLCGSWASSGVF